MNGWKTSNVFLLVWLPFGECKLFSLRECLESLNNWRLICFLCFFVGGFCPDVNIIYSPRKLNISFCPSNNELDVEDDPFLLNLVPF